MLARPAMPESDRSRGMNKQTVVAASELMCKIVHICSSHHLDYDVEKVYNIIVCFYLNIITE